jgi:hypothetical protein
MAWNILEYDTATILIALFLIVNFILMICIYEWYRFKYICEDGHYNQNAS